MMTKINENNNELGKDAVKINEVSMRIKEKSSETRKLSVSNNDKVEQFALRVKDANNKMNELSKCM